MATIIGGGSGYPQRKNWDIGDVFITILGYGTVLGIVAFPIFLLKMDEQAKEPQAQEYTNKKTENVIQRKEIINNDTVHIIIYNNKHNIR